MKLLLLLLPLALLAKEPIITKETQDTMTAVAIGAVTGYIVNTYIPIDDPKVKTLVTTTATAITTVKAKQYLQSNLGASK